MPIAPCIIVYYYQFGGRDILRTETRVQVGARCDFGITFCRLTRAVKGMAMQLRTRRVNISSGSARTAPASISSEMYVKLLALHRQCHIL